MKIKSSLESGITDADGTDAEENRQLTNLLLENAIVQPVAETNYNSKVRQAGLHVVELALLSLTFFLLKIYAFAYRGSSDDEDGFLY